jgi:hypothetical protein
MAGDHHTGSFSRNQRRSSNGTPVANLSGLRSIEVASITGVPA